MKLNDNSVTKSHNQDQCHLLEHTSIWQSFSFRRCASKN